MALQHIPGRTMTYPDIYRAPGVDIDYTVSQDEYAYDPRNDHSENLVAVYIYLGPRGIKESTPNNRVAEGFAHFYAAFGDDEKALAATSRWVKIFYPEIAEHIRMSITSIYGYSQGDWANVFAVVATGYGDPSDHVTEFRNWLYGDVWQVSDGDQTVGDINTRSPEEAVEQFIENNPPAYEDLTFDNPLVEAIARELCDRDDEVTARKLHAQRDIDLTGALNTFLVTVKEALA